MKKADRIISALITLSTFVIAAAMCYFAANIHLYI